jgi:hypothetical protein
MAELPASLRRATAALPPPRLLGAFDPLLLGWESRDPVVGPYRQIVTVNGLFRPFALAHGRAVGTWTIAGDQVVLEPFAVLDAGTWAALDTDAADVMRFLGGQDVCPLRAACASGGSPACTGPAGRRGPYDFRARKGIQRGRFADGRGTGAGDRHITAALSSDVRLLPRREGSLRGRP